MNFKRVLMVSMIGAGTLASSAAFAGATGNVGVFSEYMFRGVSQGNSAAVQGGLDYAHDSGLYVGTWVSNIGFGGTNNSGTEVDGYAGYAGKVGEVGFDVGALFYWYSEEDEVDATLNTLEFYGGLSFGPVGLKYYYSDECNFFIGDDDAEEAGYLLGTLALPIKDTLNFTATVGFYDGKEVERYLETTFGSDDDSYIDYSVGLAKTLDGGMTFTLQLVDTDIKGDGGVDDDLQAVVGVKKSFEL